MAYGQIDPARLHGEALRRWYERMPADLDAEREAAAAHQHQMFFGGLRPRDEGASTARPVRLAAMARPQSENLPKPTPGTCVSCHDLLPPGSLPPLLGPFPLRPGGIPSLRDIAGAASGGGREPAYGEAEVGRPLALSRTLGAFSRHPRDKVFVDISRE